MSTNDLSSINGLEDKHLRALAGLHITDLRGLADAHQREIYKAMENIRPRPSLQRISRWQEEARSGLAEAEANATDWLRVASFAVVFLQRQVGDAWERRVEAGRTEVEPEQPQQAWDSWEFEPVGRWMADQLAAAESASTPAQPAVAEPPAAQQVAVKASRRSRLRIASAAIMDANRTVDAVTEGELAVGLPAELTAPVRVLFTVSGAPSGTALHAVTRILRSDRPGWNPQDPVVLPRSGQAEFDLSKIPAGRYEMSLIAWAPDASANPVSVTLPALTIHPGPG